MKKFSLLSIHLLYFYLLLAVYSIFMVENYKYLGLDDSLNNGKIITSTILMILVILAIKKTNNPSFFYLNIIAAMIVTPSLVIVSGSDLSVEFAIITCVAFLWVAYTVNLVKVPSIKNSKYITSKRLLPILIFATILFVLSIILFGGAKYINFDFSQVYEFREAAANNLPFIYAYLSPTFTYAVIPTGIVLSLKAEKKIHITILIVAAFLLFGLTSHKGPIFICLSVILTYWISRRENNVKLVLHSFNIMIIICALVYILEAITDETILRWISSIFLFRSMILPSFINFQYYEFFSINPFYYWADSKFSLGLISSPYSLPMPYQVSMVNYGYQEMGSANTGWIGSGIGNAGIFGVIFYSTIMGLLLSLIDSYSKKIGKTMVFPIFVVPVITAAQSVDLATMLLTNGLLIQLMILLLLEPEKILIKSNSTILKN